MTAAKWAAKEGVVRALLAVNPGAAAEPLPVSPLHGVFRSRLVSSQLGIPPLPPDSMRWRPLQLAIWNHAPDGSIGALLRAFPAASELQDHRGMTALHLATVSDASIDILRALM